MKIPHFLNKIVLPHYPHSFLLTSIIRMETLFSLLKLLLFASLSSKAKPTTLLCETNMFVEWLTQWEFFFLFRLFQCERSAKMRTKMKKVFFMKFFSRSIFLCVLTRTCAFGCACVYSTIYECIRKWWNKYCERHVIGGMTLILLIVKISFFIKWTTPFQLNRHQSCRFDIFFAIDFDDVIRKLLIWLLVVLARDKQHLCHHIVPNEKNCLRFRPETIYFCCAELIHILKASLSFTHKSHPWQQSFDIEDIYCHFSNSSVFIAIYDFCMHFML